MSVDSVKQKNISKTLTLWNFFTIGFGAIIGTGWIFLVGEWIIISGGPIPAMLAFLLGALLLLPIGAVFGELTSALPIDGGVIEYVDRTYGKTVSFITGWLLLLSNIIMCPWETIAVSTLFGTLFGDMFPWLRSIRLYSILGADVYLFPVLIALCLSGFIIRQNLHGPKAAAKAQSFLTKALLAGLLLAIISAFDKGSLANWQPLFLPVNESTAHTQATSLWTGIFALLTVTPFFYTGFDTIPQQAEEAAQGLDWHKFGRIISLALLSAATFYIICIAAFSSLIPWTSFVKQPLAVAFETSAKAASVALLEEGKLLGSVYQNTGLTHSQTLMVMAQDLLSQLSLTPADVDILAVAAGPGSFTGVRIGVAAAKGFAWGREIPCCAVSTLAAMAAGLGVWQGYVCPVY